MRYRLIGARFRRKDGTWVNKGDVFVPTELELAQRYYKLQAVADDEPLTPASSEVEKVSGEVDTDTWPLTMRPDVYLRLHPDGPHADKARALVGEREEEIAGQN